MSEEVKKFWETDIKDLPGAIEINYETPVLYSLGGVPVMINPEVNRVVQDVDKQYEKGNMIPRTSRYGVRIRKKNK